MIVLGVDPGIHGGLAIVGNDADRAIMVDAIDIPVVGSGARERVDAIAVQNFIQRHAPTFALIERAQAMPRQGASSGFKYGRAVGALETAIILCGVPFEIAEASAWKRFRHLPGKDKERSRQRALELFPSSHALLARKRDHGRAEAALIALYGLRNSRAIAAQHSDLVEGHSTNINEILRGYVDAQQGLSPRAVRASAQVDVQQPDQQKEKHHVS
jgi:crossover junction endodeoxyribonuclease RuvC